MRSLIWLSRFSSVRSRNCGAAAAVTLSKCHTPSCACTLMTRIIAVSTALAFRCTASSQVDAVLGRSSW